MNTNIHFSFFIRSFACLVMMAAFITLGQTASADPSEDQPHNAQTAAEQAGKQENFQNPRQEKSQEKIMSENKSAHSFSFETITGDPMPLSDFEGKTLLVVNTASRCGFTKQYEDLQSLYETYKDQGLVVIGVPSNDFGGQEPGSHEEIKRFCETNFSITFPLTEKEQVKGGEAHPFYKWAAGQKQGGLIFSKPRWNFHKYIVGKDGQLLGSFGSQVNPQSDKITSLIQQDQNI